jgi:CheY-like chemotaxis protein
MLALATRHFAIPGAPSGRILRILHRGPFGRRGAAPFFSSGIELAGRAEVSLSHGPRPMRILIVDDQRPVRLAISQGVRAFGHEPETADSGRVALLKLQEERFDLVLLDLNIEGHSDGLEYIARLQKIAPGLPVVICTAQASRLRTRSSRRTFRRTIPR